MKKHVLKKSIALVVAVAMTVVMIPQFAFAAAAPAAASVKVTVSVQEGGSFLMTPKTVTVTADLAENYGYTDQVTTGVSALDVLIAAHQALYGAAFTPATEGNYLAITPPAAPGMSSYITKAFTYDYPSFTVNGLQTHDNSPASGGWYNGSGMDQSPIVSGDSVEFLFNQDSIYNDVYTWVQQSGKKTSGLTMEAGTPVKLQLDGYILMNGLQTDVITQGIPGANLVTINSSGSTLSDLKTIATTDTSGNFTLAFPAAGVYYVGAYLGAPYASKDDTGWSGNQVSYIFSPWCKVTVLPKGTLAAKKATAKTIKAKAVTKTYNSVKVSWNKVSGVTGYQVYRAAAKNGKYTKIKTTAKTSFVNTKLKTGNKYYYKVRSYAAVSGTNYYSAFSAVTVAKAAPPAPPFKLVPGKTTVKAVWKKVAGAGGYQIYRSTSKNGTYAKIKTLSKHATTYLSRNLTQKQYYYKMRAYKNVNGKRVYGSFSSVVMVKMK